MSSVGLQFLHAKSGQVLGWRSALIHVLLGSRLPNLATLILSWRLVESWWLCDMCIPNTRSVAGVNVSEVLFLLFSDVFLDVFGRGRGGG